MIRTSIKTHGSFPTEQAATKLIYLASRNFEKGGRNVRELFAAHNQFAIIFEDRFNACPYLKTVWASSDTQTSRHSPVYFFVTNFGFNCAAAAEIGYQFWHQATLSAATQGAGILNTVATHAPPNDQTPPHALPSAHTARLPTPASICSTQTQTYHHPPNTTQKKTPLSNTIFLLRRS